ncbi:MAG: NADH-quinone oxidoreductase subunit C [Taibaiella sp.]|nr:NADH-quinone oxidoreductase subunit C [Taibaiella sp.]
MALTNEIVKNRLTEQFGDQLTGWEEPYGMLTCTMPARLNRQVLQFLHDDEQLRFRFLTDLTGVHFPDRKGEELSVVYHLHNMMDGIRLRLKTYVPIEKPDVFSVTELYSAANWMERETYDFFGVNFVGHPDLRRILNVDEMEHFPMRKEFPLEDPTRTDKDDEMFGRG